MIFGASGDLTGRKLVPALHNLQTEGLIPPDTTVLGVSRSAMTDEEFSRALRKETEKHSRIAPTDASWDVFAADLCYAASDVTEPGSLSQIRDRLEEIDAAHGTNGNRVWYMATAPFLFPIIAENLGKTGLLDTEGWHRLVVEKPFGSDLGSARDLNSTLFRSFSEDQIFRIDHYLGKETVQNLLVFRFANAIFEPIWSHLYIDHVQITAAESIGIEGRGAFYDRTGALRDIGQNHLLQLLTLLAMEPPVSWNADAIRDEKVKVLKAVRRWSTDECALHTVRGQYEGYVDEPDVPDDSTTETYFAAELYVDNWRWAGVPFLLRAGKQLPARATEISIQFHSAPHLLFAHTSVEEMKPNELIIRIQPDEGFSLLFGTKVPGPKIEIRTVDMEFEYETDFPSGTPEAYERLLLDCMLGDATLFARSDEIEEAWEIMDPVLECWKQAGPPQRYAPGSWGPAAAEELVARVGRSWADPLRHT